MCEQSVELERTLGKQGASTAIQDANKHISTQSVPTVEKSRPFRFSKDQKVMQPGRIFQKGINSHIQSKA